MKVLKFVFFSVGNCRLLRQGISILHAFIGNISKWWSQKDTLKLSCFPNRLFSLNPEKHGQWKIWWGKTEKVHLFVNVFWNRFINFLLFRLFRKNEASFQSSEKFPEIPICFFYIGAPIFFEKKAHWSQNIKLCRKLEKFFFCFSNFPTC